MHNSVKENGDNGRQRENGSMEDPHLMTIEYLRARLLSERSVSKAARERADQLAKQVAELEEQLNIVTLQRKKAEKARLDILTFLENHGVSDVSEATGPDSEEEESLCESNMAKRNSTMEEECSVDLNLKRDDKESVPGYETESPPSSGRSLSWTSRKEAHQSCEKKYLDSLIRRQTSFSHSDSSPRHRLGRSCRQIKRREIRSAIEDLQYESTNPDSCSTGVSNCLASPTNSMNIGSEELKICSENQDERVLVNLQVSGSLGNQRLENGYNEEMERALENQAQLIGCFEAQEKAQREWEEKYGENNSSTPDSCEHGSHSDVTEERDETKAAVATSAEIVACHNSDQKSEKAAICFLEESPIGHFNSFKLSPQADLECSQGKKHGEMHGCKSSAPDFAFPVVDNNQTHEYLANHTRCSASLATSCSHSLHGSTGNDILSSSQSGNGTCKSEAATGWSEHSTHTPHAGPQRLEGVLVALQQAKLFLNQQMNSLPLIDGGSVRKTVDPSVSASRDLDRVKIPMGCAGLFRVPTHVQSEAPNQVRLLGTDFSQSMPNYYPRAKVPLTGGYQYLAGPVESGPSVSTVDWFCSSPASATEYRVSSGKTWVDIYSDSSAQSSSELAHSSRSSYPDLMRRVPSNEMFSRQFSSRTAGVPPSDRSSNYSDQMHPYMYRY